MAATQAIQPVITPFDRLGLTLSLAILLHAAVILGITFIEEDRSRARYDTMEIVLVQQSSKAPEDAQMLAQANLEGGGNVDEAVNPATPMPAPFPDVKPEVTAPPPVESQPPLPPEPVTSEIEPADPEPVKKEMAETVAVVDEQSPDPAVEKIKQPSKEKKITDVAETKTVETEPTPETSEKATKKTVKKPPMPSATELLTNSFRIASLSAEVRRKLEAKAQRPRRKFISATTREYNYAAYMEAWRSKVERVGNLNYPEEARRQKLSGSLVLDVALNADGSINEITIRRSSGEKILDDAAVRIVELAAPFSPFPQHIKDETDILHIMRTWQFINNKGFR